MKISVAIEEITGEKSSHGTRAGHQPDPRKNLDKAKMETRVDEANPVPESRSQFGPAKTENPKSRRDADKQDKDEPVLGMGDHVPAFMTRSPKF